MDRAIELAQKAAGRTSPNPMVGAVIVKEGRIIGEGYHHKAGELHAEREALKNCTEDPKGAELYVTLEPCCHYGKTPPCTEAIIEAGIERVFIGSRDPNPLVAGKGAKILREAGIEVYEDFFREECDAINPVFFKYIVNKEPYIALKYAMTADGKIATDTGESQWITGEDARTHVHCLRDYYAGILVGIGTVLKDNPRLTCRIPGGRNPARIVLDTHLRIPVDSDIVKASFVSPLFIVYSDGDEEKGNVLEGMGAQLIKVPAKDGEVDLRAALKVLGEIGIDGILVEGGAHINNAFLREGLVDCVYVYIGAKLFGGAGLSPITGIGIDKVSEGLLLTNPQVETFDDDVLIVYDVKKEEK